MSKRAAILPLILILALWRGWCIAQDASSRRDHHYFRLAATVLDHQPEEGRRVEETEECVGTYSYKDEKVARMVSRRVTAILSERGIPDYEMSDSKSEIYVPRSRANEARVLLAIAVKKENLPITLHDVTLKGHTEVTPDAVLRDARIKVPATPAPPVR